MSTEQKTSAAAVPLHSDSERPAEYPFDDWALAVEKATMKLKGWPRHCARSAFRGLRRAWTIAESDPEMALFRAITAEEEAATALMIALQRRKYPSASKLKPRNHIHKAGFIPFFRIVENVLASAGLPPLNYQLHHESKVPRLDVRIPAEVLGLEQGHFIVPDEPLNVVMHEGDDAQVAVSSFATHIDNAMRERGVKDMWEFVSARANVRNQLLYAADNGIAHVSNVDSELIARLRGINLLLILTVAILQTKVHQLFAVQLLAAYIRALGQIPDELFDFDAALRPPDNFQGVTILSHLSRTS